MQTVERSNAYIEFDWNDPLRRFHRGMNLHELQALDGLSRPMAQHLMNARCFGVSAANEMRRRKDGKAIETGKGSDAQPTSQHLAQLQLRYNVDPRTREPIKGLEKDRDEAIAKAKLANAAYERKRAAEIAAAAEREEE
jgi:hypothetical protein